MLTYKDDDIWLTAIVSVGEDSTSIYFPDIGITVHGDSFLSARIKAEVFIKVMLADYVRRGVPLQSIISVEDAQLQCTRQGMFVDHMKFNLTGGVRKRDEALN